MSSKQNQTPPINLDRLEVVLATDCGSTTTKAILFEKKSDGWHQTFRGEAPTTVEKPVADVTIGARNAFREVQELSGRQILSDAAADDESTEPFYTRSPDAPDNGIDLYVSTSSAGGGLQMIVAGVVGAMSAESAERAALGAGAIVMDTISIDDGRETYERVQKIRHLRPDIVLLAGGTDGGTIDHPLELAETILQADPRPRFGDTLTLPVIYAANRDARQAAQEILAERFSFSVVDNLRPSLEIENLAPARDAIHDLFLEHVMSHAPGYRKLIEYTPVPIIPTPAAVGTMVQRAAERRKEQILAVDIGGATTDVFSVFNQSETGFEPYFNRTVSANLGMSYSVANVLLEAGEDNIRRWLPFEFSADELRDRLRNKMIRPTSIPFTLEDLLVEQAICREALRLAFEHHKRLASGLKGKTRHRTIGDLFRGDSKDQLVDMLALNVIIGSGGVLSHAPDRRSSALMMLDAFQPEGVTRLAVDSIFMMPHLGVFSEVHPEAALDIFIRDCIVPLGTSIAPRGVYRPGKVALRVELDDSAPFDLLWGELRRIELGAEERKLIKLRPQHSTTNIGNGPGKALEVEVSGGHAGIVFDARGRPLQFPKSRDGVATWYHSFGLSQGGA